MGENERETLHGILAALLALDRILLHIAGTLEKMVPAATLNLSGRLIPKDGGSTMALKPPINVDPAENDLGFTTTPANGAGTTLTWALSDPGLGTLEVAPDTLSAKVRTVPGFAGTSTLSVTDGTTTDREDVIAAAGPALNLSGALIAKGA
jgi:hypothetical protein